MYTRPFLFYFQYWFRCYIKLTQTIILVMFSPSRTDNTSMRWIGSYSVYFHICHTLCLELQEIFYDACRPNPITFDQKSCLFFVPDLSDVGETGGGPVSPHAINYSTLTTSTPAPGPDPALSSTETLLRNIQGLLKVAADNARQQERQINYEKGESTFKV